MASDNGAPPCGKLGTDPDRIVYMCVLPDGHDGECSYEQRAGTLPRLCAWGCGLAAMPGDIYCAACGTAAR